MEPIKAWAILRNGVPVHVRLNEAQAEACAKYEGDFYQNDTVEVVALVMKEDNVQQ
jgi:hypothetical protein